MTLYIATRSTTGLYTLDSHIVAPFRIYGFHHHDPVGGGTPGFEIAGALFDAKKRADISLISAGGGGDEVIDTVASHGLNPGDEIFFNFTSSVPILDGFATVSTVPLVTRFTIASVPLTVGGPSGEVWLGLKPIQSIEAFTPQPIILDTPFGVNFKYLQAILPFGNEAIIYYKGSGSP